MADDSSLKKTERYLKRLAYVGIAATLSTFTLFAFLHRDSDYTDDPQAWGQFGDFIGGTLNPIIGLLGVVGLLWTIYQNQKELSESREQLRQSAESLRQQRDIAKLQEQRLANQEIKEDLFRLITFLVNELDNILDSELLTGYSRDGSTYSQLRKITHWNGEHFKIISKQHPETFHELIILLERLAILLQEYSQLPDARNLAVEYFTSKFYLLASQLHYCHLLSDSTADYYDAVVQDRPNE